MSDGLWSLITPFKSRCVSGTAHALKTNTNSSIVPYREHDIFRGPYGYAQLQLKAGVLPKRQYPFSHIGERGEALGEIIRINVHKRGRLEELRPGSERCSRPLTVRKPAPKGTALLDKWRTVIAVGYLNSQMQDDQAPLPLIEDMLERHERQNLFFLAGRQAWLP